MTNDKLPPVTSVRLPPDLRKALRIKAAQNEQSLTGEIIQRLERSLQSEGAGVTDACEK
jgi:plasmid stability protein